MLTPFFKGSATAMHCHLFSNDDEDDDDDSDDRAVARIRQLAPNDLMNSTGIGKMMVEFFSEAICPSVCR